MMNDIDDVAQSSRWALFWLHPLSFESYWRLFSTFKKIPLESLIEVYLWTTSFEIWGINFLRNLLSLKNIMISFKVATVLYFCTFSNHKWLESVRIENKQLWGFLSNTFLNSTFMSCHYRTAIKFQINEFIRVELAIRNLVTLYNF